LGYPRGSVNALPNADNMLGEVNITDAKREGLTDPQAQNGRNGKNRAEWFWGSPDHLSHFFIRETALLFPDAFAWQSGDS